MAQRDERGSSGISSRPTRRTPGIDRPVAANETARPLGVPAPVVLIADDDPGIRRVLAMVFEEEGFDVRLARSAAEALNAAQGTIGVAVVDLKLGCDDGARVVRELAARADLAVIVMSGAPGLDHAAADAGLGADAVVTKPFKLSALVERVRREAARLEGHGCGDGQSRG